jgi:hypothetical protein
MSAIICYRNLVDAPGVALSLTSGAPLSGYPLDHLLTRQLARSTRLQKIGNPTIIVDLGAALRLDIIGLIGINASTRTTADVVVEYSSNGLSWNAATAVCPLDLGAPDLPRSLLVRVRPAGLLTKLTTRYLRITPNWTAVEGYREIGRLYIADSLEVPQGCDRGWTLGSRDYGVLDRSAGLQYYADRRTRGRVLTMPMTGIDPAIAFGFTDGAGSGPNAPSLDDLINYAGATGDVIVAPRADSPLWLRRTGVYGHLSDDSLRIEHQAGPNYACTLTVEEER